MNEKEKVKVKPTAKARNIPIKEFSYEPPLEKIVPMPVERTHVCPSCGADVTPQ